MAGRPIRRARIAAEAARKAQEARARKVEGGFQLAPGRASLAASWAALVLLLMVWVPLALTCRLLRVGIDLLAGKVGWRWTLTFEKVHGRIIP